MNEPTAQPAPQLSPELGAIELKTSFFPLAIILYLFGAKAVIDGGGEIEQGWGTKVHPVAAGRHSVRVWCPYFFVFKMGDGEHVVDVVPGQVTAVEWKCPWLVFLQGTFVTLGSRALTPQDLQGGAPAAVTAPAQPVAAVPAVAAPVAAPAAGWHPDPQGQAALRYWDGLQWTEHVAEGQPATA